MALMTYPKKVVLGDITVRDGFQHEEKFIPTEAKLWLAEQLVLAGFKRIELTNFGNPKGMPQFKDADALMKGIRGSKKVAGLLNDVEITAITIREKAAERAMQARKEGWGPDRILFMVSTSESHHRTNSGLSLADYWKMCEQYIPLAHEAGLKVCGTVSTIWGCPIEGPTELKKAVEFTRRWLDIGADDIEHADHDGSAPPDKVYEYYSMILDAIPDPTKHVAHFHYTLVPASIFILMAAGYFWLPKWTGHMYNEKIGQLHFWLSAISVNILFFPQHFLGLAGMPRRIPDYAVQFADWNMISSIGGFIFGLSQLLFLYIVIDTIKGGTGEKVTDEVWEDASKHSLEWTLPTPIPYHTWETPPTIVPTEHVLDSH